MQIIASKGNLFVTLRAPVGCLEPHQMAQGSSIISLIYSLLSSCHRDISDIIEGKNQRIE